ncbi:MAG: CD225/dispanin family protein [Muribaculaceae bacterium]|nr:CD225/dispanin family protein [Muribaculaceae bacterium]
MRKIAVFTSGGAESTERLITLFNEGNRIRIDAVVTDGDAGALKERFGQFDVEVIGVTPESSPDELAEVRSMLTSRDIELYAFEDYDGVLAEWINEHYPERVVSLTSADQAPREVVAALAAIDKSVEQERNADVPPIPKTVDEEWAETLQIDFDSKRAEEAAARVAASGATPPPIPGQSQQVPPIPSAPSFAQNPQYGQQPLGGAPQYQGQGYGNRPVNNEPMPPTYLVWSVIMTVLCCLVPGVVAIIFSSQVSTKYYAGDIEGAKRASRRAEIWIIVSFVLGVLSATLYVPIMMVSGS